MPYDRRIPEGAAFGDHLPSPGGRWLGFAEPDEGDPAFPKNRAKMMGKPVGAAISRPSTFETERLDKTLYPVSWRAASSRPYEAYRLSEVSVAVSLFPLIRPGLCPGHLPRRGRRPPGGGFYFSRATTTNRPLSV